jgi:hypothetical protein
MFTLTLFAIVVQLNNLKSTSLNYRTTMVDVNNYTLSTNWVRRLLRHNVTLAMMQQGYSYMKKCGFQISFANRGRHNFKGIHTLNKFVRHQNSCT